MFELFTSVPPDWEAVIEMVPNALAAIVMVDPLIVALLVSELV